MNRVFKSLWNQALGAWTAVPEFARSSGKGCLSSRRAKRFPGKPGANIPGGTSIAAHSRSFPRNVFSPSLSRLAFLTMLSLAGFSSSVMAADYAVDEAGGRDDTAAPPNSLSGALQGAATGNTIQFSDNIDLSPETSWLMSGYSLIQADMADISLDVDLDSHTLSASQLGFHSGTGTFTFKNGTLFATTVGIGGGVGADYRATVKLDGSTISADALNLSGAGSALDLTNASTVDVTTLTVSKGAQASADASSAIEAGTLNISEKGQAAINGQATLGSVTVTDGGKLTLNGTSAITGSLKVSGVHVAETAPGSGIFTYDRSTLSGTGTLDYTGNTLLFNNGASVNLGGFSGYTASSGQSLAAAGIISHAAGGQSYQTEVALGAGDLVTQGGSIRILDGAKLTGVQNIRAEGGAANAIVVGGAVKDADSGATYRAEVVANGTLSIGTATGAGAVEITNGGKIGGITSITLGTGNTGSLLIKGTEAASVLPAELAATGSLVVGDTAGATLTMADGGRISGVTNVTLGKDGQATVSLDGVGTGDRRTGISASGSLLVGGNADASLSITKGAQFTVGGTAVFGDQAGTAGSLSLSGRGGNSGQMEATLATGDITLGNEGNASVTIGNGGSLRTGTAILAKETGSTANVTINTGNETNADRGWLVGGTVTDPGYAKGNANLTVEQGIVDVRGFLSMGGQDASGGKAIFSGSGAELRMGGGTFRNQGDDGSSSGNAIGDTVITNSAVVSGSGNIIAGNQFRVEGATISPGSRWMYDFDRNDPSNALKSLGILHITDHTGVNTLFKNATFQTQLDRANLSDQVVVHGNLEIDNLNINMSRALDGGYLLIKTVDGGTISGYADRDFSQLGADAVDINLNGKTLKGNDRIDIAGGLVTEVKNSDTELWLTVDTTTSGNVITHWSGASGNDWNMAARNFESATTGGTKQFLDGDIVTFDDTWMTANSPAGSRIVDITTAPKYAGNVIVPEVRVFDEGASGTIFTFNGGKILAYDSAFYTTLDKGAGEKTPSGELVKIGSGTLVINNANEFYGGVHLGGDLHDYDNSYASLVQGGGIIEVNNNKAFGSYNSESGFLSRGVVYVHESSKLIFGQDVSVQNRFVVDDGKILDIVFTDSFTINNNNATADSGANSVNDGKGGGIYIGDGGQVVYSGSEMMHVINNQAILGGGIYTKEGYTLAVPTDISRNIATQKGGGIYAEKQFALRDSSDIIGNATYGGGGGVYVGYDGPGSLDKTFTLHGNSSLTGNLAGNAGGGLYADGGRTVELVTKKYSDLSGSFKGRDIWFEGNYSGAVFDPDDPTNFSKIDLTNATRNAMHLAYNVNIAQGAVLNIGGPYNTYFYDPVTGDAGTQINITGLASDPGVNMEAGHGVAGGQSGTTIFQEDSQYYGSTTVSDGATFRLEKGQGSDALDPVYGRKGTLAATNAAANTFEIKDGATLAGQGKIAADAIRLDGIVSLDTGSFSRPTDRDGTGTASFPASQGTMELEGAVTIADTAQWHLNLTNSGTPKTDLINVTGTAAFSGATAGEKLDIHIDDIIRGKYTLMTSTGNISGYNTDVTKSDAQIYNNTLSALAGVDLDLSANKLTAADSIYLGRLKATSYVDAATQTTLSLDIIGRNRHVTASDGGTWAYNSDWIFSSTTPAPANTGSVIAGGGWSENDTGPATSAYIDGDMVTLTGGNYTLGSTVKPVDLFIDGTADMAFSGTGGISTYSTAAADQAKTTITTNTADNDYGIAGYTGKLYKVNSNTLTFSNTAGNTFAGGVEIGKSGDTDGGTIAFSSGNQLQVGDGKFIDFISNGTLRASATTTLASAQRIEDGMTASYDTGANTLTLSGTIADLNKVTTGGAITKNGSGTLVIEGQNTFTGGTTWNAGTIRLAGENAANTNLGAYTTAGGTAGLVSLTGGTSKTLTLTDSHTIRNRFELAGVANNQLILTVASGQTLTIDSVNAGTSTDGGAITVNAGAEALLSTGSGTTAFSRNKARDGGAIHAGDMTLGAVSTFTSNEASRDGGAIHVAGELAFNAVTTLSDNTAGGSGGAIKATSGNINFAANATLATNTATTGDGGAIHAAGNVDFAAGLSLTGNKALAGKGGGIYTATGKVTLNYANTTALNITGNQAQQGGAIYAKAISLTNSSATARTISGNTATGNGGAFYVAGGTLDITAQDGNITFTDNTAGAGGGEAVYLDTGSDMTVTAADKKTVEFADTLVSSTDVLHSVTKNGLGMLAFTGNGNNNSFYGSTQVDTGTFRVAQGVTYGAGGTGSGFTLDAAATLSGGGTLKAEQFNLHGTTTIDKAAGTTVAAADKIGMVTLAGDVTLHRGSTIVYDLNQTVSNPTLSTLGQADLLKVDGTLSIAAGIGKVTLDIFNYQSGIYKLIDATTLDATASPGDFSLVFDFSAHGEEMTDRHRIAFKAGNDASVQAVDGSATANQLWLAADYNNLRMVWTGAENTIWKTDVIDLNGNWLNRTTSGAETHVENRDSVVFQDAAYGSATPKNKGITLGSNVVVTNMVVDTAGTYSFSGTYGITTSDDYAGDILTSELSYAHTNAPQKLEKKGTGTLAFTNTGTNNFAGGIDISAGTIQFSKAAQLGTGTAGITFSGNARLEATATGQNLTNAIHIGDGKIATFATGAHTLTLSGQVSGGNVTDAASLTKEGAGTLILTNTANDYNGLTTISGGTLKADGVSTLGKNTSDAANGVVTANGSKLALNIASGSQTLDKLVSGAGSFEKMGNGTAVLGTANTYTGNTIVSGGILQAGLANAFASSSQVTVNANTTLDLNNHNQKANKLGGAGNVTLGSGTLTANNATATDNSTLSGTINGTGDLVKTGSGTFTLNTASSSATSSVGNVSVEGGTLNLSQNSTFTATGNYTTKNGATTTIGSASAKLDVKETFTQEAGSTLNVTIGAAGPDITAKNAALNGALVVTGFSSSAQTKASDLPGTIYTVIRSDNAMTGAGFTPNPLTSNGLDYLLYDGHFSADKKDYNLGFRLAWTDGQDKRTGSFTMSGGTSFEVDVALNDQTPNSGTGWDGKSLTKNGDGTLILSEVNGYTGTTTVNGGTLQLGTKNDVIKTSSAVTVNTGATLELLDNTSQTANKLGGAGNITLGSGTTLTASNATTSDSTTFSGAINGTGGLTKAGAGMLTLSGSGSSVGNVTVNEGTLNLAQSGDFTVTDDYTTKTGATTTIGAASAKLKITDAFTQQTGATLNITMASNASWTPAITADTATLDGALTVSGYTQGTLPTSVTGISDVTYTLIHTTNGISGDFASKTSLTGSGMDYLIHDAHKSEDGKDYNIGYRLAWTDGKQALGTGDFTIGSGKTFDVDIALSNQTSTFDLGWDGKSLAKKGDGTLILSKANTYDGATTVSGGTLKTGIANAFANSSAVTVGNGTVLDLNNHDQKANKLSGSGSITLGTATLTANNAAAGDTAFSGIISGTGGLTKTGGGIFTLAGANIYTGATTISGGTLKTSIANAFASSSAVTVDNGTTLDLNNHNQKANKLSGDGSVTLGTATLTANNATTADDTAFSGTLTGGSSSALSKTGAGKLTLSGTGSFIGRLTVGSGAVNLAQNGTFTATGDYTTQAGATTTLGTKDSKLDVGGTFTQAAGSTLEVTISNPFSTTNPSITTVDGVLGGNLVVTGFNPATPVKSSELAGKLHTLISSTNAMSGGFTTNLSPTGLDYLLYDGHLSEDKKAYNIGFRLAWTDGQDSHATGGFTIDSGTFEVDTILSNQTPQGSFATDWDGKSLTKNGAGTLILSAANTYTGATTVNGGVLQTGAANAFALSSQVTLAAGTTLDLNNHNQKANKLGGAGDITLGSGTLTVDNTTATTDDTIFSGTINGTGGVTKTGAGMLTLSGNPSSVGNVSVNNGTLNLAQSGTFTTTGFTTENGATTRIGLNDAQLVVNGQFEQKTGSTLQVAVGASPDITATNVKLAGTLVVNGFADTGTPPVKATELGSPYTIIQSANNIVGDFATNPLSPSGLNYLLYSGYKSDDKKSYNLGFRLAWEAGTPDGTGAFTLAEGTAFDVDIDLTDKTGPFTSGWDGKSLTKEGTGTLVLSGANNTYTGSTTVNGGILRMGVANAINSSSDIIVNNGTLDLNGYDQEFNRLSGTGGTVDIGAKTLTVLNAASGTDDSRYAGAITGTGKLLKEGAGTLTLAGVSTVGTTHIDAGTLQLDGGKLTSGELTGNGTNLDLVNAAVFTGTIKDSSGAVDASVGQHSAWNMTENSTVKNLALTGHVRYAAPTGNISQQAAYRTLTVDTVSGSGSIHLNTNLGARVGDMLVADSTSGSHVIYVTNRGGNPAAPGESLKIIEVTSNSSGEFSLNKGRVDVGAYRYTLVRGDAVDDGAGGTFAYNNWYLYNTGMASPLTRQVQTIANATKYATIASLNDIHKRMGELRLDASEKGGVWMRSYRRGYENNLHQDARATLYATGGEIGADRLVALDGKRLYLGGLVGYADSTLSGVDSWNGESEDILVGAYASLMFDNGSYIDLVGRHFWLDRDYRFGGDGATEKGSGRYRAYSFDIEAGHRLDLARGWFLEPQAELTWLKTTRSDFSTDNGNRIVMDGFHTLLGRAGITAGRTLEIGENNKTQLYGRLDHIRNFTSNGKVSINGDRFSSKKEGGSWVLSAGLQTATRQGQFHVELETGVGSADVKQKWGINFGARWAF